MQQSTITIGTIGQLYSTLIGEPSPILLLGAGASLRSGIPLAGGVVERAARWAYRREHGWTEEHPLHRSDWVPWLEEKSWYNRSLDPADNYPYVVEHLLRPRQSRKEFFQHLLRPQVDPSPGYEKLVEFLHLGTIQTVLTTNFDSILPRMQAIKGRPHYLTSIQIPADLVKFSTSPPNPQLVYLHGSIEHYTDQNLVEEVQTLNSQLVERLLPLLRDHPLIVVGYRGAEASVMQHLLAQNAPATNNFCHGVFWCTIKSDAKHDPPLLVSDFAKIIGSNFTQVEIDGFDELFSRDLWKMHENAESFRETARSTVGSTQTQSFETQTLTPQQTEELEWSTVSGRILTYCETLRIRFPVHPDRVWLTEQLHNLNLAAFDDEHRSCVTKAGYLLFGKHPQDIVHSGRIRLTVRGTARWLARVGNDGRDEMTVDGAAPEVFQRTIEGNLWSQYDQVNDILSAFNRPFRLKGEFSENVMPYPPLSLKEIVVNADSSRTQYPDFPGFSAIFRADLITSSHLTVSFEGAHSELNAALALTDTKLRFETVLDVYSVGIKRLAELEATRPNVIFCCIPDELIAKCWSIENSLTEEDRSAAKALRKRKTDNQLALFEAEALEEQPEDLLRRDFRRALKARAMHSRIPVQLATNGLVLDGASGQGPATRAWNSCVGLYYKAGGIPWRLRTDGPETCFVGVSFHHLQTTKRHLVHSSIAQAFSNQGEGFALRGGSVDWSDEQGREVHLSNEQAARLAVNILEEYRDRTGGIPLRVVLHKTSMFSASESQGFRDALSSVPVVELINWMPTQFRLVRFGSYPPNRGTFCRVNDSKSYIFTTGYMPELGTYPGPHIPAPAELRSDIPQDLSASARDILALSRMNWNTASITGGTPVTLAFARKVGGIMSEFGQKGDEEPLTSFRYYM